jgi:hypothetical protein
MPVFSQLCQAARKAQEKNLISQQLAERICAIGQNRLHYKHLGLELHSLVVQLAPARGRGDCGSTDFEELVRRIEEKHRRI